MIIATIIIPAHNRAEKLERAIASIIEQNGSDRVEIIVVDDNSLEPLKPSNLRMQDRIIRNCKNLGAAISRNKGISQARGEWIYLLDSDDYVLKANFESLQHLDKNTVYYSELHSQSYQSKFPKSMLQEKFFNYVLHDYPYICQTSTLSFHKCLDLRFDESLPKHQDWDFILFSCLMKGIDVKHGEGCRFFDRDDKNSISRTIDYGKTNMWLDKLKESEVPKLDVDYFQFCLQGPSKEKFTNYQFLLSLFKYLFYRKVSIFGVLKLTYKRFFK